MTSEVDNLSLTLENQCLPSVLSQSWTSTEDKKLANLNKHRRNR